MIAMSIGKSTYDITIPVDNFPVENSKNVLNTKIESCGGSACNVSCLLAKWNVETYNYSVVGYDDYGTFIKKDLEASGVKTRFMEINYEKKTTTNFILNNKSNTSRTSLMIEPEVFHLKKNEFDLVPDVIYMDGFEYTSSVTAMNKFQAAYSVLGASLDNGSNPKEVLTLAKYAKYLILSLDFAEALTKMKVDFNAPMTLLALYKEIKNRYPNQEIIITLKNMGAMYQIGEEVKVMPTIEVEEKDRTGAGDIFDGAFCYALMKKYDIEKSIRLANIAASLSTTKIGAKASIPTLSEVISYYEKKFGPIEPNMNNESNNGVSASDLGNVDISSNIVNNVSNEQNIGMANNTMLNEQNNNNNNNNMNFMDNTNNQ